MNFGKAARSHWCLEADCTFLNHGSFGAAPRVVLEAQTAWRQRLEQQPVRFMGRELGPALRAAADRLATCLGGEGKDLVFVDNATTGINAVLRSLEFAPGDAIVTTNHVYGAVRKTLQYLCRRSGATLLEAEIPFPLEDEAQVLQAIATVLDGHASERIVLLVVDRVTSPTALVFPIEEIVRLARSRGVPVLVDGAHAPGMLDEDLTAIDADWYVGNCHKWLGAPKGCGFLWAKPERQADLHPVTISHGLGEGYLAEFDWTGTRDFTAWLAVTAAIAFWESLDWQAARTYNRELVLQARQLLAETWQVALPAPDAAIGSMATVPLPSIWDGCSPMQVHDYLWDEHRIEVPIVPFVQKLWIRISSQVYNVDSEYRRLASVLSMQPQSEFRSI